MKVISIIFVVCLIALANSSSRSWGNRVRNDYMLIRENVVRSPQRNNYISANVDFPKSGQISNKNITAIYVYDRFTNSSGATPNLWSGGPGKRFVTINLKSQYSQGMNSTVEIYGK